MKVAGLWRAAIRIAVFTFFAGTTYFLWLAAVLLTRHYSNPVFRGFAWVVAPVATAGGFAVGLAICNRVNRIRVKFLQNLIWPLLGCAIGAAIFYVFGAMLIVFGMFGVGGLAVALRELIFLQKGRDKPNTTPGNSH